MTKLRTGFVKYFQTIDESLNWKFIPISKESRFPARFRVNVEGYLLEIALRINPVAILDNEPDTIENRRLILMIKDVETDEVYYEDVVTERIQFKVNRFNFCFATIIVKEENMIYTQDYGGEIQLGVAIE